VTRTFPTLAIAFSSIAFMAAEAPPRASDGGTLPDGNTLSDGGTKTLSDYFLPTPIPARPVVWEGSGGTNSPPLSRSGRLV
jgi:hypothetical protein